MIDFKEILEKFPSNGLDNLGEKMRWEYDDAVITPGNEPFPEEVVEVIDDLYEKVSNYDYDKIVHENEHPFLECKKELSEKLGFDSITVCPYKDFEREPFDSNFIYTNTEHGGKSLIIDIYDVVSPWLHQINNRDKIEQEFMNFLRDAQWVIDGVYEDEMQKMKDINIFDFLNDEEINVQ